jgi:hypothetical protein
MGCGGSNHHDSLPGPPLTDAKRERHRQPAANEHARRPLQERGAAKPRAAAAEEGKAHRRRGADRNQANVGVSDKRAWGLGGDGARWGGVGRGWVHG